MALASTVTLQPLLAAAAAVTAANAAIAVAQRSRDKESRLARRSFDDAVASRRPQAQCQCIVCRGGVSCDIDILELTNLVQNIVNFGD